MSQMDLCFSIAVSSVSFKEKKKLKILEGDIVQQLKERIGNQNAWDVQTISITDVLCALKKHQNYIFSKN